MTTVSVQVQADYLERLTKVKKPIISIAELIWNGLDADASTVRVELKYSFDGALSEIRVVDDGHGMTHEEALDSFRNLGGSWKRGRKRSIGAKRLLHGRAGKGRFRAFSLGNVVTWETVGGNTNADREMFTILGTMDRLGTFEVSDPRAVQDMPTGTTVTISELKSGFPSLLIKPALQELAEEFAIYLRKYRNAEIQYGGSPVDPRSVEKNSAVYELPSIIAPSGKEVPVTLEVIEWRMETERHLFLCDHDGFSLHRVLTGIHAAGFNFTAYLKSDFLRELDDDNQLELNELNPELDNLLAAARTQLKEHFRKRSSLAARELVNEWKALKVYPFEGEPVSTLESARRQVFDVIALNVYEYLPDFGSSGIRGQRLSLKLLKEALEDSPSALRTILTEVLDLPPSKREDLAILLQTTSLSAIISSSKLIADRLNFLHGLEIMVFDPITKKVVLERRHLHKILERETWLFGEEFSLSLSDRSLNEVLRRHIHILGREEVDDSPVLRADGTEGIVDLMLSRTIPQLRANEHEHLIVEIKRPTKTIDADALQQIKSYAFAVAEDDRFRDTTTKWYFWAVSTAISPDVMREARQRHLPPYCVFDDGRIQIWVKTWGQILEDARARLKFFEEGLEFDATDDTALTHLRSLYEAYLPASLSIVAEPSLPVPEQLQLLHAEKPATH